MKKLCIVLWMLLCSTAYGYNDKVKTGDEFVVVVGADWCQPCRDLDVILKKPAVKKELKAYAYLFHVDGDKDVRYRRYYKVKGYPTVLKFKKTGEKRYKVLSRFVGLKSESYIIKWLKKKSVVKKADGSSEH